MFPAGRPAGSSPAVSTSNAAVDSATSRCCPAVSARTGASPAADRSAAQIRNGTGPPATTAAAVVESAVGTAAPSTRRSGASPQPSSTGASGDAAGAPARVSSDTTSGGSAPVVARSCRVTVTARPVIGGKVASPVASSWTTTALEPTETTTRLIRPRLPFGAVTVTPATVTVAG